MRPDLCACCLRHPRRGREGGGASQRRAVGTEGSVNLEGGPAGGKGKLLLKEVVFSMCDAQWCRLKGEEPPASVSKWWGFLLLFQMTWNNETLFPKMRAPCIEVLTWNNKPQCIVQERMQLFSGSKVTYLWEVFPYFPHFVSLRNLND